MGLNRETRQFAPLVAGMTDASEIQKAIDAKQIEIQAQVAQHDAKDRVHRQRNLAVLRGPYEEYMEAQENGAV